MGDIKTKKCNCLGTKKLRDIAYIKSELRREHALQGLAVKHLKRTFGNPTPESTERNQAEDEEIVREAEDSQERGSKSDSESEDDTVPSDAQIPPAQSFTRLAQQMGVAADADSDLDADEEEPENGDVDSEQAGHSTHATRQVSFP
jgi:hypothetical protein